MHQSAIGASTSAWISIDAGSPARKPAPPIQRERHEEERPAGRDERLRDRRRGRAASPSSSTRSGRRPGRRASRCGGRGVVKTTSAIQWTTSSGTSTRQGSRSGMPVPRPGRRRAGRRGRVHAPTGACSRYHAIVRSRPSRRLVVRAGSRTSSSARVVSSSRRGWPFGFDVSQTICALVARQLGDQRGEVADRRSPRPCRG